MNEIVEKIIANPQGFIKANNYKLVELKDEECILSAPISKNSINPYGIAHGGFLFGLADTAAGVVAAIKGREAVTTNASILYMHKARGENIKAIAKCLKRGTSLVNIEVELKDDNDNIVAKVLFEYFYI